MAGDDVPSWLGDFEMDTTTLNVLAEGRWSAHVMTKPAFLTIDRLRSVAVDFATQMKNKLELKETPEVAMRHCRGLDSRDGSKRSILVRHTYGAGRVRVGYTLISCMDTEDHLLLLSRGQDVVREVFEAFLEHHFRCRVAPLQLTYTDLSLFFTNWVRYVSAPPDKPVRLKMAHPTVTQLDLSVTILMKKCLSTLREVGLDEAEEISEDDAQHFVEALCREFTKVMPMDLSTFSLKSVHLPGGSLHRAGRAIFADRVSAAGVLWYLMRVAETLVETL